MTATTALVTAMVALRMAAIFIFLVILDYYAHDYIFKVGAPAYKLNKHVLSDWTPIVPILGTGWQNS